MPKKMADPGAASAPRFDPASGIVLLDELIRLTAPPAGEDEICDAGLGLLSSALLSEGAALFIRDFTASQLVQAAAVGRVLPRAVARSAAGAIEEAGPIVEKGRDDGSVLRVLLPLPGESGPTGVLVLERPARWDPAARDFARSASRALAAALSAARKIRQSRTQGELLARRNVELETLRELAYSLQNIQSESRILEAALELVLSKLGLEAGWIFWGETRKGRLELAAAIGVEGEFVRKAREEGLHACLCEDVFATGRRMFARNTVDCPRLPDLVAAGAPLTHACIPLKFERGVLGVMNIANRPGKLFSPQELRFLETVGNQVCLAVDKARTARAETRSNAEARALASLARAIGGSLERERVLSAVGEYAREFLGADRCAIYLGESLPLTLAYLSGPELEGLTVGGPADLASLESRAFPEVLRRRHTTVISNTASDPRSNPELARRWNIGSAVLVPLVVHDRLEGVLQADRARPSDWRPEELELADAFGRQAAVAIENARLYHEAQDALVRLQKAQYGMMKAERMAAVGTLAASLAHEVRNPLNSIHLQLVLLARRLAKMEEPARAELSALLETARLEIARLDGLVEEFLSLSTIDRLSRRQADVNEVVRDASGLMAPAAREKEVVLAEQLAAALPPIALDREKIKQVLINLLRNAVEAMPGGGSVTLSTALHDGVVRIHVADTGPGIAPGLDVFDFFSTTKGGGTGLGLPISKRIVEAHGGSLSFVSEPGRGTVFTVTLPLS